MCIPVRDSSKTNVAPQQTQNYDRYNFLHLPKSYTKIIVESVWDSSYYRIKFRNLRVLKLEFNPTLYLDSISTHLALNYLFLFAVYLVYLLLIKKSTLIVEGRYFLKLFLV